MRTTNRKIFNITVTDSVASFLLRQGRIVCGNDKYRIRFTFDSEWDGQDAKIARFNFAGKHTDVPFTGNEVDVPVISGATSVEVGVYTEDGPFTTTGAIIPCELSILCKPSASSSENDKRYLDEARRLVQEARDILERLGKIDGVEGLDEALAGKLDKVTTTSDAMRVYTVSADGTAQGVLEISHSTSNTKSMICAKAAGGIVKVGDPKAEKDAVPLGYANEHYVSKATSPFILPRAHCVQASGLGEELITVNQQASDGSIPRRGVGGVVEVGTPKKDTDAVPFGFADGRYMKKTDAASTKRTYIDWVKDIESQFWIEDDGEVYEHNRGTYILGEGRYDVYVGFDTDATKGVATFEPFSHLTNSDFDPYDFYLDQIIVTGDTNAVSVYVDRNCSDFTYCPVMRFNRTTDAMPEHFLLDIEEYKREGRVQLLIHVRHIAPEPD